MVVGAYPRSRIDLTIGDGEAWEVELTMARTPSLEELRPAPYNPRAITAEALTGLKVSLHEFGDISGLTWNRRTGHLISGHQRLKGLQEKYGDELQVEGGVVITPAGERFPVRVVDWPEAKEKAANLAANSPLIAGVFTEDLVVVLQDIAAELPDLSASLMLDELAGLVPETGLQDGNIDPDEIPEIPEESVVTLGDLWSLGDHRLLCGDSTSTKDVARLMGGSRATLMATDPPYLVNYQGGNHPQSWANAPETKDKHWDDYHEADGTSFFQDFLALALAEALSDRPAIYQWHASRRQALVEDAWKKSGLLVHQQIIWAKARAILTRSDYMWQHEPCFYGWVEGKRPTLRPKRNLTTVWPIDQKGECDGIHPTQKPVRLFEIPIESHTRPGALCYEPFSGSGSQIIAAERLGRRCSALEIEPRFVEVGLRRWAEFTGEDPVRNDGMRLSELVN